MFWLKKVLAFWLMPLPFCLLLLGAGVWLARTRRPRLGRGLVALALLLLVLASNKAVSTWLLQPLEYAYPPLPEFAAGSPPPALARCRYVAVLGGGNGDTAGLAAVNNLSPSSQSRLMEALRLLRALPDAKLVVSGANAPGRPSHAAELAQAAVSLGADPARIVRLDSPRDTDDEAVALRRLVGDEPFALVTSAWHMRRAMALVRHQGLHPLPCPADYRAHPPAHPYWTDYTWDLDSLDRSTRAVHEQVGYLWEWLRGRTGDPDRGK
ncbi:MAG TPA: ElyC/SanA/YdcF family protein [Opitutus sp.]|nr:ElyC/SanA/YdcF family protein [Opitutus sp.]